MHIKTGDKVVVISGKDKGKEGVVLSAQPSTNKAVSYTHLTLPTIA